MTIPDPIHSSLRKPDAIREFLSEERTLFESTALTQPDAQEELLSSQTKQEPVLEDVPPETEVGLGTPAEESVARVGRKGAA